MNDPLAKEFNQTVKRSQQSALLEHLAAIKRVVTDSESAVYGFGDEALRRVEALSRYVNQLPGEVRESLKSNLASASTLKQQIDEIGKLDRLVECYRQRELHRDEKAAAHRSSIWAHGITGAAAGLVCALSLIALVPDKFQTDAEIGSVILGLPALLGAAGLVSTQRFDQKDKG